MIFLKYFSITVVIDINAYYVTTYVNCRAARASPNSLRNQGLRQFSIVVRYVRDNPVCDGNEFHTPVDETGHFVNAVAIVGEVRVES